MAVKYLNQVTINLPIDKVIELFDNADNMKHWQPGLKVFEHVSGIPGEVGAVSRLKFEIGKRKIEMMEVITVKDLPHKFSGTYTAKNVFNEIDNRFEAIDPNTTRWTSNNVFEFKGFMKIIGLLMPGAFKKQSQKYMDMFKDFAENGTSQAG